MAKPSSDVAICNLALDLLKESVITALTGDTLTKTEALCARWYDVIRQSVLQSYNWNFALVSAPINRGGTPTVDEYEDYYTLPNDYLKLRAITDPEFPLTRRKFEIQGNKLLYNNGGEATLDIWYTADNTTVTQWPSLFIKLFSEEFALVLGKKLTARPSILKEIRQELTDTRRLARSFDGQVRPPKSYESSRIVNAGLNISSQKTVAGAYEFPEGMDE